MMITVDTNVIIDALQKREPWSIEAEKIFLMAADRQADFCITATSVSDIHYLIHHYVHNENEVRMILEKLFSLFSIIPVTKQDCLRALSSKMNDYEDALIDATSLSNGSQLIITRNIKDFKNSVIPAMTPKDFLNKFKNQTKKQLICEPEAEPYQNDK